MSSSTWTHHRARVANAERRGDTEAADAARLDLKAARAADYIAKLVDDAPPLTDEQRTRLASLLAPVGGA